MKSFTECHYVMLCLVCGVLWVHRGLLGSFFVWGSISYWYVTCSNIFEHQMMIMGEPMPFLSKTVQHLTTIVFIFHIMLLVTVISRGLWPRHSLYLNPCNFYLCCMLKEKLYRNSLHTKGRFTHSMLGPCRAPALLRQCRVLHESPRGSRKYPNC
jgi:hypothetical protein